MGEGRENRGASGPSVVIEHEWNYLLNPGHPDFSNITWDRPTPFSFDPRLLS
jgi:RES domain-containing protein